MIGGWIGLPDGRRRGRQPGKSWGQFGDRLSGRVAVGLPSQGDNDTKAKGDKEEGEDATGLDRLASWLRPLGVQASWPNGGVRSPLDGTSVELIDLPSSLIRHPQQTIIM
jgi:hypothetical protein